MIKARLYRLTDFFWKHYFRFIIHQDFSSFTIHSSIETAQNKSFLIIANHFSWWDGFFIYHLNEKIIKKRFHVMMEEEELKKRKFLTTTGAFSINKKSRQVLEAIRYSTEILNNAGNVLLMFPQGKIESMYVTKICFEKGVYKIVENVSQPIQIIFSAAFVNYFSNRKPQVDVFLKHFEYEKYSVRTTMEQSYNEWYTEAKLKSLMLHEELEERKKMQK